MATKVEVNPSNVNDAVVSLNIGGKKFRTNRSTLDRYPDSKLSALNAEHPAYIEKTEEFFFDHNPRLFPCILDFLRNGMVTIDSVDEQAIREELEYWGLADKTDTFGPGCQPSIEGSAANGVAQRIWKILDNPRSSKLALIWALFYTALLLVTLISIMIDSMPQFKHYRVVTSSSGNQEIESVDFSGKRTHMYINIVCTIIFFAEFLLHFATCPKKLQFFLSAFNVFDLLHSFPLFVVLCIAISSKNETRNEAINFFVALSLLFRALRILKIGVLSSRMNVIFCTLRVSLWDLALLCIFVAIQVVGFSAAVYYAEANSEASHLKSIPDGFWYAVVTLTTVGYGDMRPISALGKAFGALCTVQGIANLALVVVVLNKNFCTVTNTVHIRTKSMQKTP